MQASPARRPSRTLVTALLAATLFSSCIHVRGRQRRVRFDSCDAVEAAHTGYHLVAAFFHIASALSDD